MGKIIVAKADSSSLEEKLETLIKLEYLGRSRWDNPARICVLPSETMYADFLFCEKNIVNEFAVFNEERNKTIVTTIFQPLLYDKLLFATNLHYNQNISIKEYEGEAFVSISMLLDSKAIKTLLKGGKSQELLDFVQLARYDPLEEHHHINNLAKVPCEQTELYNKYFGQVCKAPHFHFASKQNIDFFNNPTHLAINLYSLISYLEDLILKRTPALIENDLGLPILTLKDNPFFYQTSANVSFVNLIKTYGGFSEKMESDIAQIIKDKNAEISKNIAQNFLNTAKSSKLCGLEALYIDLVFLASSRRSGQLGMRDELTFSSKIISLGQDSNANKFTEAFYSYLGLDQKQKERNYETW